MVPRKPFHVPYIPETSPSGIKNIINLPTSPQPKHVYMKKKLTSPLMSPRSYENTDKLPAIPQRGMKIIESPMYVAKKDTYL